MFSVVRNQKQRGVFTRHLVSESLVLGFLGESFSYFLKIHSLAGKPVMCVFIGRTMRQLLSGGSEGGHSDGAVRSQTHHS